MIYHVSMDLSCITEVFKPRIPKQEQRMEGENNYIPRICVAKSIEDCLTAMPNGGYAFENSDKPNIIRVYEFEPNRIKKENLISPADLYFSEWVLDAWVTGEYWVVRQDLIPFRIYDVQIISLKVFDAPFVKPHDFKQAYKKKKNPEDILDELERNTKESVARITDLKYRHLKEYQIPVGNKFYI